MKTGIVETAAILTGECVKKGTAEKGVVIGTDACEALGIISSNDFAESFAVGEQVSIAQMGEVTLAISGTTIITGQNLAVNSYGLVSVMGTVTGKKFRVARALENGLPNEAIEVIVTNDFITD